MMTTTGDTLLQVRNLRTFFFTDDGVVKAVDGVSFSLDRGRTLALVGESGSGKTVTSYSVLRLVPDPPGRIVGGEILFKGRDLTKVSDAEMRHIRGNEIAMIFQEPMTSLNPVLTIGEQIIEAIVLHRDVTLREARAIAIEMLRKVGIADPELRIDTYPHRLSGGMKQRVMIAMALCCGPDLLIADEPTTALDVTIQAQILDLVRRLQTEFGMSMLFITHDLGVVAEIAHDVAVMYKSKIVEVGPVHAIFQNPLHPYTIGLLNSIPRINRPRKRLPTVADAMPPSINPLGRFKDEPLREVEPGHFALRWDGGPNEPEEWLAWASKHRSLLDV